MRELLYKILEYVIPAIVLSLWFFTLWLILVIGNNISDVVKYNLI